MLNTKVVPEDFFDEFSFLKRYSKPNSLLKNLVTNEIGIIAVNDGERNFVFDLMKGYNVNSIFKKSETKDLDNRNLYERSKFKALESTILLKCEKKYRRDKKFSSNKILKRH